MNEIESAFRKCELFSKEEIIQSVEMTMDYYRDSRDIQYTQLMRKTVLEIWGLFLEKVKKAKLPVLTELWKYYAYEYIGEAIVLHLCEGKDVETDEEGFISSITVESDRPIIKVECPYITIDEYAIIQNVKPNTVRQWIQRGKLKYAKYQDNEWLIPILEERPARGYQFDFTQYQLTNDEAFSVDEYPLVALSDSISIFSDDKVKEYTCRFENHQTDFHEKMELSKEEMEQLEYILIRSGKYHPGPRGGFVPLLPKAYEDE